MKENINSLNKEKEWKHSLVSLITGLLLFETITGLSIYFLPFSITNQVNVLLHTLIGFVFIIPFIYYLFRHWNIHRTAPMNHYRLTGYILMLLSIALVLSGVLLTYEAIFKTKSSKIWNVVHTIGTFAFIAFIIPHVVLIVIRDFKARRTESLGLVIRAQITYAWKSLVICGALFGLVAFWVLSYQPIEWKNEFPEDYSQLYGIDRPFAPSFANTDSEGAFDPRSLGGSLSCGTVGCHEDIVKEWAVSAHRYSAMDVVFQKVQDIMGEQNGPKSTRYCAGCHNPISLISGLNNIYTDKDDLTNDQGYQEGISCIACHAIKETDTKGNANYVLTQPSRYMYELKDGKSAQFMRDFLIKSYPDYHIESLQHKLLKSPDFCAACHKQLIDEGENNVSWVQMQNQYDQWRNSKWNHPGDATTTIECRECHMPLVNDSSDPGSGDDLDYNRTIEDGMHRSHRFLGTNQFIPQAMNLPGAKEQVELTEKWLQGKIEIPEIKDKWAEGPAVPIEIIAPDQVNPGEEIKISTVLTNNKPGHSFPTGPIDIIQAWVEIIITDQDGNEIYVSGRVDDKQYIQSGSIKFNIVPVDHYGNPIDKNNLGEMVGVKFKPSYMFRSGKSMFPGFSNLTEFSFSCPSETTIKKMAPVENKNFLLEAPTQPISELNVTAKFKYRKIDPFLINFLFGDDSGFTIPITLVSEDQKTIKVEVQDASDIN